MLNQEKNIRLTHTFFFPFSLSVQFINSVQFLYFDIW